MALFAGIGIGSVTSGYHEALLMVFGIMAGSTLWEFSLSMSIKGIFHRRINTALMRVINFISGSTILAFAALSFRI